MTLTVYWSLPPFTGRPEKRYVPLASVVVVKVTSSAVPRVPSGPLQARVTVTPGMPGSLVAPVS